MEIKKNPLGPIKVNKLLNEDTIACMSRNITIQPGGIYNRKSKFFAFVVNAGMNVIFIHFKIKTQEKIFFVI